MGKKSKGGGAEAEAERPSQAPASRASNDGSCAICAKAIDADDERLEVTCRACGTYCLHLDCAVEYLVDLVPKITTNSTAKNKYLVLARQRPKYFFQAEGVPCPAGAFRAKREGPDAGCAGITIDADVIKPVKQPAAPPPQPARPPPGAAKKQQQAQQVQQGALGARKPRKGPPSSGANSSRSAGWQAGWQPAPAAAPRPPPFSASGGGGGLGVRKPGMPQDLQMCAYGDECRIYNCAYCHSEEELRVREQEWHAARAARQARAEAEAAAAQRAAQERAAEEAALAQQVADAIEEREMMLGISQPTIALLKRHKRAACMRTLLSYAFSHTEAAAAAAAAGCDAPVAARLLFAGQPCAGFQPVEITSEVQELLTLAAALGLPAPLQTVEEQLVAAHGDWDAAQAALEALAASSAAASNSDWGGWEQLGASRAASEEPSVNGPAGWEQQQPGPSPAPSLPATPSFNGAPQPPYDTPPRGSATPSAHLAHAASSASWQQGGASASDCDAASAGQPPASWAAPEPPSLPVPQPLQAAGQPSAGYPPAPPAGAPLGSPLPQPAPAVHAGFKDGFQAGLAYTDGYQAGLAAAMAALQQPSAAPGPHSGYAEPQAQLAGGGALPDPAAFFPAAGAAPGWEHAQAPAQHAQAGLLAVPPHLQPPAGKPDAELDDLLGMLGIA